MTFSWTCPFCHHKATIISSNFSRAWHAFDCGNKHGNQGLQTKVIVCPNSDCNEFTIDVSLHNHVATGTGYKNAHKSWKLKPQFESKIFPAYIPSPIIEDYLEAASIKELSPKASSTLSRRCLQGMIRDFWGVKPGRLIDEIESIKDKVDPVTWAAIDAVRKIGNIGAHMENDINLIIEVDPDEARFLIELIEILINDWYIVREERKVRMESIIGIAKEKKEAKNKKA